MEGSHAGCMYPLYEDTDLKKERMKGSFPKVTKRESSNGLVDVSQVKFKWAASPPVRSVHRMVLRSRAHLGKLNRNQSARDSGPCKSRRIFVSDMPAPCLKGEKCPSTQASLSRHQNPYIQPLMQLKTGFQPSMLKARNSSISARRLRYLRHLQKMDTALYLSKSAGVAQCSHSCVSSSDKSLKRKSLMSVGSFQMLYKIKKGDDEHQHATVLPLNLEDLQERRPHRPISSSCYNLRPRECAHTGNCWNLLLLSGSSFCSNIDHLF